MLKRFFIFASILNIVLCLIFHSLAAILSIQLAFLANTCIPLITFYNIKKRIPKFVIAHKVRIFIQNPSPIYEVDKKINFKAFKHFGVFMNIYKFLAYFVFALLVMALIRHDYFHVIAFFVASIAISVVFILIRVLNVTNN